MRRLYEAPAYDSSRWPDSHWRASLPAPTPCAAASGSLTAEVAVIGAGYAGLNAALALNERHGTDVVVLEAGQPGWGASGRNGGFCCLGGAHITDADLAARLGEGAARGFRDFQHRAIEHVDELLTRHHIDARQGPEGEVCLAHSRRAFDRLLREAEDRHRLYGEATEVIPREGLHDHGLGMAGARGAAILRKGFPIHPLAYVEGLARLAMAQGIRLFGDSPVTALTPEGDGWRLVTPGAEIRARRVLIATNGYSSEDLPGWLGGRTLPVQSAILVTRPLSVDERQAQGFTTPMMSYDSRTLLHYVRHLPDGRFLFGMRGGTSARAGAERRTAARVRRDFVRLFPAWRKVEVETQWSGFVCMTGSNAPFVGPVPNAPGLYAALGWHGNGVAAASLGGTLAADLIAGVPVAIPALMRKPPRRFLLPPLRRPGLRAAYFWHAWRDGPLP